MSVRKKTILHAPGGWRLQLLKMRIGDQWIMDIGSNNPVNGRAAIKRLRHEHPEYVHLQFKTETNRMTGTFTITRKQDYDTRQ